MAKQAVDVFSNVAYARVEMSAVNTLTFEPIRFAVGVFQGIGIIIHRILYAPFTPSIRELAVATDQISMALTLSDKVLAISDVRAPAIIDTTRLVGMGVNVEPIRLPIITDWTALPGGGKLFPANPLFAAMTSLGAA
ncbi:unnamed protein product, partial [marine sediment metagenome]